MTKNPEIQRKLQEEIDAAFGDEAEFKKMDYNKVQGLPYLDMCIHEALRLHSPASMTSRSCTQDYT